MPCKPSTTGKFESKTNVLRLEPIKTPTKCRPAACDQVTKFSALQKEIEQCIAKCRQILEKECNIVDIIEITFRAGVLQERAAVYIVLAQNIAENIDRCYANSTYKGIDASLQALERA